MWATTRKRITAARIREIHFSIDASSTGLIDAYGRDDFLTQLAELDPNVLFCNQDEAALLRVGSGHPFPGSGLTVIKAGKDPVQLVEPAGATTEVSVPIVEDVADTTGAGDAFAAGFLVAAIEGATPIEAAARGVGLATTVLRTPGAGGDPQ